MDKLKSLLGLMVLALLLAVACSPGTAPGGELPAQAGAPVAPLAAAKSSTLVPEAVTAQSSSAVQAAGTPGAQPAEAESVVTEKVSPVVVDLSQITPVAGEKGEPRVAPAPGVPFSLEDLVNRVRKDLADRLGQSLDTVTYLKSEEVTWPDSSLGCPEEGMAYLMVLTPGLRITLAAAGREYTYHTGRTDQYVLCQDGHPAKPQPSTTQPVDK